MVAAGLEHNSTNGSWNISDQRQSFADVFPLNVRVVIAVASVLSGGTSLCLHVIFLVTIGVTRTLGPHVYHLVANAFVAEILVAAVVVSLEVMNILASSPLSDSLCTFLALLRLLSVSVLLTSYALLAFFLMIDISHPNWFFLTGRKELKAAAVLMVWLVPVCFLTIHLSDTAVFTKFLMSCEFVDHWLEFFMGLFLHLPSCVIVFVFYFITRRFHDKFFSFMVGLRVDTCLLLKHESNTVVFNTLLCLLGEFALCHELPRVINLLSFSTDSVRLAGFVLYMLRTSMAALTSLFVNTDLHKAVNVLFSRNKGKVRDVFDLGSTGGERENLVENKEVNEPQIVPILYPDGEDGTDPTVATSDNYREIK